MNYYTEEQVHASDTRWMMNQLPEDVIGYIEDEARKLDALQIVNEETGALVPHSEWVYEVTRDSYISYMKNRSVYCGEMGDC